MSSRCTFKIWVIGLLTCKSTKDRTGVSNMCLVGQSLIATPVILLNYSLHFCSFCEDASFTREGNFKACFDHKDIKIKKAWNEKFIYFWNCTLCRSFTNQMGGGSIPCWFSPHAKVSLGKTVNPDLLPIDLSQSECLIEITYCRMGEGGLQYKTLCVLRRNKKLLNKNQNHLVFLNISQPGHLFCK